MRMPVSYLPAPTLNIGKLRPNGTYRKLETGCQLH